MKVQIQGRREREECKAGGPSRRQKRYAAPVEEESERDSIERQEEGIHDSRFGVSEEQWRIRWGVVVAVKEEGKGWLSLGPSSPVDQSARAYGGPFVSFLGKACPAWTGPISGGTTQFPKPRRGDGGALVEL